MSNWIYHLRAAGVKHFLVGSMDDTLLEALASDGVETFSMASGLTTGDFGWWVPIPPHPRCCCSLRHRCGLLGRLLLPHSFLSMRREPGKGLRRGICSVCRGSA